MKIKCKNRGKVQEGPGAGYFIKLKDVDVSKVWLDSSRDYSILKASFSADWEVDHSYWGGYGSADDFEVAIYLSRSLSEFMDWPGAEDEYQRSGSLYDFVKDTCLDDIKDMLNFDCGRYGYTYGGGWVTSIPADGDFKFDSMQFDPDSCTVYQFHDKNYVPVTITSVSMAEGIQDAYDEWSNPEGNDEPKKSEKKDDYALFFETHVPGELTGARMFLTDMWNKMGNKKPRITFETEDPDFDSFVSHPTARVFVCGDTRSIASYARYLLAHYDEIPKDFEGRWVWKDDLAYFARGFKESLEAKKDENLTDKEEHEWYRFWFDDVKKHIVPGKSGSVEHNCKMLPYSDVRQMWGVAAMAKELCDNFRRYLSYRGYTNSKGSPFAEISWSAEDAGDLLTAMNKAEGTPIESKKSERSTTNIETYDGFEELLGYADAEYLLEDVVDVLSKYYTYEDETFDEDQAKGDPEFTIKIEGGDERADYYYENVFYVHLPSKEAAEELADVLGGKLEESRKKSEGLVTDLDKVVKGGNLRYETLIPKLLALLQVYGKRRFDAYVAENPEVLDTFNLDDKTGPIVVDELMDIFNEIAPEGVKFGFKPGNGLADAGFFIDKE